MHPLRCCLSTLPERAPRRPDRVSQSCRQNARTPITTWGGMYRVLFLLCADISIYLSLGLPLAFTSLLLQSEDAIYIVYNIHDSKYSIRATWRGSYLNTLFLRTFTQKRDNIFLSNIGTFVSCHQQDGNVLLFFI